MVKTKICCFFENLEVDFYLLFNKGELLSSRKRLNKAIELKSKKIISFDIKKDLNFNSIIEKIEIDYYLLFSVQELLIIRKRLNKALKIKYENGQKFKQKAKNSFIKINKEKVKEEKKVE